MCVSMYMYMYIHLYVDENAAGLARAKKSVYNYTTEKAAAFETERNAPLLVLHPFVPFAPQ